MTTTAIHTANEATDVAVYVDPYPGHKGNERIIEDCGRCAGTGVYDGKSGHKFHTRAVGYVTTGCFYCDGTGKHTFLVSSARSRERRAVKARNAQAAADARNREINAAELITQAPLIAELKTMMNEAPGKLGDRLWGYVQDTFYATGDLPLWNHDEAEIVRQFLADYKAKRATLTACPEGKLEITGKVLAVKWQDGYMPGSSVQKMLIECEGYKLWGSVPAAISAVERGSVVAFTATVEQSQGDEAFGIFKRPSKARVTEEPAAE